MVWCLDGFLIPSVALLQGTAHPCHAGFAGREGREVRQGEKQCLEGLMPLELFSRAVLGAQHTHNISSLKFREELKEMLWQGRRVSTGQTLCTTALTKLCPYLRPERLFCSWKLSLLELGRSQFHNGSVISPSLTARISIK